MGSSAAVHLRAASTPHFTNHASYKYERIKIALFIIAGLGCLAAAGLLGFCQLNLSLTASAILTVVGVGFGAYFLAGGITRCVALKQLESANPPERLYRYASGYARQIPVDLQAVSNHTLALLEQGYYENAQYQRVPLQSAEELKSTTQIFTYNQDMAAVAARYRQKVLVIEKDSLAAAQECAVEGRKVAVVNFAGAESAGGGFLERTGGQEERLLYRTDLAALMKYYFEEQTKNPGHLEAYPLYDHLLLTGGVRVFKNSSFELLDDPFRIGVLSSAAPVSKDFNPFADTAFEIVIAPEGKVDYADEATKELLKRTIYTQLKAAYDLGYETLVTGAFGCGAFKNPPEAVADMYKLVIETYFQGAFKEILFAIIECDTRERHNPQGNIAPFQACFSSR